MAYEHPVIITGGMSVLMEVSERGFSFQTLERSFIFDTPERAFDFDLDELD